MTRRFIDLSIYLENDVVTMRVEGVGTISNRVVAGREPWPVPRATRAVEVG